MREVTSTSCNRPRNPTHTSRTGRLDSLRDSSKEPRFPLFLQWSLIRANCYEYALELVAFVRRIQLLRKARKVEYPFHQLFVDLGPVHERDENGFLVPCNWTRARTSYIQKLHSRYPWATSFDWLFALEGWDAGVEWVSYNSCRANNNEPEPMDTSYTPSEPLYH
jgi:hypothetical protein